MLFTTQSINTPEYIDQEWLTDFTTQSVNTPIVVLLSHSQTHSDTTQHPVLQLGQQTTKQQNIQINVISDGCSTVVL